jgi:hypothetical protein
MTRVGALPRASLRSSLTSAEVHGFPVFLVDFVIPVSFLIEPNDSSFASILAEYSRRYISLARTFSI